MTDLVPTANPDTLSTIKHQLMLDPRLQSRHTRRAYLTDLSAFELWRAGRPMTKILVESYAVHLREQEKAPNTINRTLASVRWWARRLADLAYEEPMPKAQRDEIVLQAARVTTVRDVAGERPQPGRHIGYEDLAALLAACRHDPRPAGARDGAIFALAWMTGLRRSEICALRVSDLKADGDVMTVTVAHGKGNKVRKAYLTEEAQRWLRRWLAVRGHTPGPLFWRIRKSNQLTGAGLTPEGLVNILATRCLNAAIGERTTWHDFRRTFAGNLLENGVDLATTQRLMGHSSPITTSSYDRRPDETRREAVRRHVKMPSPLP